MTKVRHSISVPHFWGEGIFNHGYRCKMTFKHYNKERHFPRSKQNCAQIMATLRTLTKLNENAVIRSTESNIDLLSHQT